MFFSSLAPPFSGLNDISSPFSEDAMKKAFGIQEDFNNGVVTITVRAYSGYAGDWRGAVFTGPI